MWMTLERNIFRANIRLRRLYSVNVENVRLNKNISAIPYEDDEVVDQSWDAASIRSDDVKSLRIAILGLPNVGKSTLINQLVGRPVCAASAKVQTTQVKSDAVYIEGNTQLVFVDTPGLVTNRDLKKFKLDSSFKTDVDKALAKADIVGVLQDASHPFKATVIDERVLAVLNRLTIGVPSLLILNKIDKIKNKKKILGIVDVLTSEEGWPNFSDIFMISALQSDGVEDLRRYFIESARNRDWDYNNDTVTNDSPETIMERAVRAKFMDILPKELPYLLKMSTEHMAVLPDGSMNVIVEVTCPTDRISKIVMGKGGGRVKMVAMMAEQELCQAFRTTVRLKIGVKFTKAKDEDKLLLKNKMNR